MVRRTGLLLLLVLAWAVVASSKPLAPVQVSSLFKKVLSAEDHIEERDWAAAANTLNALAAQFTEVRRLVKGTVGAEALDSFQEALRALKDAVGSRNTQAALSRHGELQGELLGILENFEFRNPPALLMAAGYVKIAGGALEKGRFGSVSHDMEVILDLAPKLGETLRARGFARGRIEEIGATARAVMRAAEAKKRDEARAGLDELGRIFAEAAGTQGGADSQEIRER